MNVFEKYVSNTLASNGNQTFFEPENPKRVECGMVFIKVFKGGNFPYIFAFSGVIDSTFGDGSRSVCNYLCPPWKIHSIGYAVTDTAEPSEAEKKDFMPLTFDGSLSKCINGEKLVFTDPKEISAEKNQYICLKITFSGERVPCHEESIVAIYRRLSDGWKLSPRVPVPVFTGVERNVKKRIAFIGDSITQGIGTQFNSYMHYAARIAEALGDDYAFWDLGLGYSRGADAATDGAWLERAKHNDVITVCFGVNDMFHDRTAEQITDDLNTLIDAFKNAGLKVVIQTVPPFDYNEPFTSIWRTVNKNISTELANKADGYLNTVDFLSEDGKASPKAKYGGHPDNNGNAVWAENLLPIIKKLL